ncbi:MAG: flavin oxidoreductase/NADH oxidase [Clostridia bacterium]|nr:flavin oxidoreductase/NADH oxidase [Clostridia bacterium]
MKGPYYSKDDLMAAEAEAGVSMPYSEDLSILSSPLCAGAVKLPNRLACQAMEGCDGNADGTPGELTLRRYERFAKGGSGLIWFEATAVMDEGKANPRQLRITKENLGEFKRTVDMIKETGFRENGYEPAVVMQATHSGRYSKPHGTPAPLIAYNSPVLEADRPIDASRIVTDEYLDTVRDALVEGAMLAEQAGFDGVDIKCCHRYLNSELLSAFGRPGRYGGSFENRTRLLRESVSGAREACGVGFEISSRMNVYDGYFFPYGFGVSENTDAKTAYGAPEFDPSEPVMLLKQLYESGMRIVNITMGNPYNNPHVNRPFAKGGYEPPEPPVCGVARLLNGISELKSAVPELKFICSGVSYLGTVAPNVLAGYIEKGGFDVAGFGRTIFAYPDFANDILKSGVMKKNKACIACSKCTEIMRTPGGTPGCVIRDPLYTELYKQIFGSKK